MSVYRDRDVTPAVVRALENLPVVVLTGMRQTGKTTLLREDPAFRHRRSVTLDDLGQLEAARKNPEDFVVSDGPLTIDEAQKCPELFTAIKRLVDRKRHRGRYLLSGSSNFALLKNMSESLAGRALYLGIQPFSRREMAERTGSPPFLKVFFDSLSKAGGKAALPFEGGRISFVKESRGGRTPRIDLAHPPLPLDGTEILTGGMPSVCLREIDDPSLWFRGFEQTYLERDLRDITQVADLGTFRRLMHLAALRTAQILNQSDLGRDAKLNAVTTGRYLDLMETSFIIDRLPAYLGNRASRLIKSPKLYFTDAGMAAHLAGVEDIGARSAEPMRGALVETFVAQNLRSILGAHWPDARLHYWNIQSSHEVDFVIESGRDCLAVEVKDTGRWQDRDLQGLDAFLRFTPHCRAAVLAHNGESAVKLGDRLWALPLGLLLS